jgi:hypothetical protein
VSVDGTFAESLPGSVSQEVGAAMSTWTVVAPVSVLKGDIRSRIETAPNVLPTATLEVDGKSDGSGHAFVPLHRQNNTVSLGFAVGDWK